VDAFNEVLGQAIERRLEHDSLQAALSLTGGLDSRMVLAWARPKPGSLPFYTFGGPYRDCADVKIAKRIAAICEQPHTTIRVDHDFFEKFTSLAQECTYLSDGVAEVWGAVELHVNRLAAQIAPVRLTGNYGSEILRSSIAFRPRNLNWSLFAPEFHPLLTQAAETYAQELQCHRLSFIAFKQVPWYHYALFSLERSALIPRSPFLDNELVRLAYRAPSFFTVPKILELIRGCAPQLGSLQTDRAYQDGRRLPLLSTLARARQEITVRAEYAYDYGMPDWAVKADRLLGPLHLEHLFLGRHKFYHYRVWYRDQLGPKVRSLALDLCEPPSCYRLGAVPEMVSDHLSGCANHTRELHKLLSVQLAEKLLLKKSWDT
jgi:asparagine synthase (glutamine-hydrolysing)